MGGLRAGVCLAQWSSFTHPERGRERERERKREGGKGREREIEQGPRWAGARRLRVRAAGCCQDHFTQLNSSLKQDQ